PSALRLPLHVYPPSRSRYVSVAVALVVLAPCISCLWYRIGTCESRYRIHKNGMPVPLQGVGDLCRVRFSGKRAKPDAVVAPCRPLPSLHIGQNPTLKPRAANYLQHVIKQRVVAW